LFRFTTYVVAIGSGGTKISCPPHTMILPGAYVTAEA